MHFSQILNSGERQKIYHKNADDGAHQINHPVTKLLHPFSSPIVRGPARPPCQKSGRTGDGKKTNDEKIGNGLE